MEKMEQDHGIGVIRKLMEYKIPCLVFTRNLLVREELRSLAIEHGIPVFQTSKTTSDFMGEVIRWLKLNWLHVFLFMAYLLMSMVKVF